MTSGETARTATRSRSIESSYRFPQGDRAYRRRWNSKVSVRGRGSGGVASCTHRIRHRCLTSTRQVLTNRDPDMLNREFHHTTLEDRTILLWYGAVLVLVLVSFKGNLQQSGQCEELSRHPLHLEEVSAVTVPDSFAVSGISALRDGSVVAWSSGEHFALLVGVNGITQEFALGDATLPLALAVPGDSLLEIVSHSSEFIRIPQEWPTEIKRHPRHTDHLGGGCS